MLNYIIIDNNPVFRRIFIDSTIRGTHIIQWELRKSFVDPLPYTYYIEFNKNFNSEDSWETVGGPFTNVVTATIHDLTYSGKVVRPAFRIRLTTPRGTYLSQELSNQGLVSERQYIQLKTLFRRISLYPRNYNPIFGFLLKRKWFGTRCDCVNPETREITNTHCSLCYGTGFVGGYWFAGHSRLIDVSPQHFYTARDAYLSQPTTDMSMITASTLGLPIVDASDIIVRRDIDRRYYIRAIRTRAEIVGIPFLVHLEMGMADFDDIIYKIPIPDTL